MIDGNPVSNQVSPFAWYRWLRTAYPDILMKALTLSSLPAATQQQACVAMRIHRCA